MGIAQLAQKEFRLRGQQAARQAAAHYGCSAQSPPLLSGLTKTTHLGLLESFAQPWYELKDILLQHKSFSFCFQANTNCFKSGYTSWTEVWSEGSEVWRALWCSFQCKWSDSDPRLRLDQTNTSLPFTPPPNSLNILFFATISYGTEELMIKSDQP